MVIIRFISLVIYKNSSNPNSPSNPNISSSPTKSENPSNPNNSNNPIKPNNPSNPNKPINRNNHNVNDGLIHHRGAGKPFLLVLYALLGFFTLVKAIKLNRGIKVISY